MYEGSYPVATSIARPLIAKILVDVAKKEASFIAHGCTAKGNDQVRFDVSIGALAPDLEIIAPMREWVMTREEEIEYAEEEQDPHQGEEGQPLLHGREPMGQELRMRRPRGCLAGAARGRLRMDRVSGRGARRSRSMWRSGSRRAYRSPWTARRYDAVDLIEKLNAIAGENGVGRIDQVEDRLVGIKSREIYECPAAVVLIKAHKDLEKHGADQGRQQVQGERRAAVRRTGL